MKCNFVYFMQEESIQLEKEKKHAKKEKPLVNQSEKIEKQAGATDNVTSEYGTGFVHVDHGSDEDRFVHQLCVYSAVLQLQ